MGMFETVLGWAGWRVMYGALHGWGGWSVAFSILAAIIIFEKGKRREGAAKRGARERGELEGILTWIVIMEPAAEIVRELFVCDLDKPGPLDHEKTVINKFCECMRELEEGRVPREKALFVKDFYARCEGIVRDIGKFHPLAEAVYSKGEWLLKKPNPSQEDVDKMDAMGKKILRLREELMGPFEVFRQKIATLKTDVENGIGARVEM